MVATEHETLAGNDDRTDPVHSARAGASLSTTPALEPPHPTRSDGHEDHLAMLIAMLSVALLAQDPGATTFDDELAPPALEPQAPESAVPS